MSDKIQTNIKIIRYRLTYISFIPGVKYDSFLPYFLQE
jgi:hypothetical protein